MTVTSTFVALLLFVSKSIVALDDFIFDVVGLVIVHRNNLPTHVLDLATIEILGFTGF